MAPAEERINILELVLQLRSDKDFFPERNDHAFELFLSQYPHGTVRKRIRHVDTVITTRHKERRKQTKTNYLHSSEFPSF